jgi:LysR family transcriptional regulator, regulator for bpeEF and oprC
MKLNIDLNRAYLFIKIVEAGNLSKAATLLNEPKAKLSRNLALLESELGVQLVYRTTRQFKLTEAGMAFYQNSKQHLEALMEASLTLQDHEEQVSGLLRITAPDDIGIHVVTKIINEFSAIYPKVNFELIYTNEMLDLVKLGVDIAFRVGNLKDSTLIQKKIANIEFFLAASPKYLARSNTLTDVEELDQHQTIGFIANNTNVWRLSGKTKKISLKLKHKLSANNFFVIRDLIKSGHGIGYLPKFICQSQLSSGEIVHVLKQWGDEGSPLQMAIPHQKKISRKVKTFMDFAAKRCLEYF